MKKRILALMLAILAVCTVLASCASSEPYDFDSFDQFITLPDYDGFGLFASRDTLQTLLKG